MICAVRAQIAGWVRLSRSRRAARVTEHDPSQRGPVEGAVAADDIGAEPVDDGGEPRGAGFDDLARHGIGVDDDRPERRELGRHGRFAGADPPGEAHAQHVGDPSARAVVLRRPGRRAGPGSRRWRPAPSGSG